MTLREAPCRRTRAEKFLVLPSHDRLDLQYNACKCLLAWLCFFLLLLKRFQNKDLQKPNYTKYQKNQQKHMS